jgi:hypothetical protein
MPGAIFFHQGRGGFASLTLQSIPPSTAAIAIEKLRQADDLRESFW